MDMLYLLLRQTMYFSIPLLIVALGGMFSERSGVTNIALEGIMVMGGFTGIYFINQMQSQMSGQWLLVLAIFVSMAGGLLLSLPHAYASVNLKADQVISGTALNMFAPAFVIYIARMIQPSGIANVSFKNTFFIHEVPVLCDIPVIGDILFKNTYITTFLGFFILIVSAIVLYKTRFGMRLRACGEHPHAADSVGINVYKMRYIGVMISGVLAGLGGLVLTVPISTEFKGAVNGYGFLALAVLIFGQWKPIRILWASLFFGFMQTISAAYSAIPFLLNLNIPSEFFKMTPYIATLIVLAFSSKSSKAPKAVGQPYDQGAR
ncbi:MAG TPA: ABC transporter permease [Clostridia bacterium]|nr:ABC transporter permease [Clostridia bacterium]HOR90242.1 ABC transporter permease [Clostridia bacterium]HPL08655.1 ABC transporter permease [Clostridia bacterium]